MERRFRTCVREVRRRLATRAKLRDSLTTVRTADLIAALAAAETRDEAVRNAAATELLNRNRRAPFLAAFLVTATLALAIFLLEWFFTGDAFFLSRSEPATVLAGVDTGVALVSVATFLMWRGMFPGTRMAIARAWRRRF